MKASGIVIVRLRLLLLLCIVPAFIAAGLDAHASDRPTTGLEVAGAAAAQSAGARTVTLETPHAHAPAAATIEVPDANLAAPALPERGRTAAGTGTQIEGRLTAVRVAPRAAKPAARSGLSGSTARARALDHLAGMHTHRLSFLRSGGASAATTTPPPDAGFPTH